MPSSYTFILPPKPNPGSPTHLPCRKAMDSSFKLAVWSTRRSIFSPRSVIFSRSRTPGLGHNNKKWPGYGECQGDPKCVYLKWLV